jgi:hypothetical protein
MDRATATRRFIPDTKNGLIHKEYIHVNTLRLSAIMGSGAIPFSASENKSLNVSTIKTKSFSVLIQPIQITQQVATLQRAKDHLI